MNTNSGFAANASAALMMNPNSSSPAMRIKTRRYSCATHVTGVAPPNGATSFDEPGGLRPETAELRSMNQGGYRPPTAELRSMNQGGGFPPFFYD